MTTDPQPELKVSTNARLKLAARIALWIFGVPAVLVVLIYVRLFFGPMPLPFVKDQAERMVLASMPDSTKLTLGDAALALNTWYRPVLRFSPVLMTDVETGSKVAMEGLDIGFSPVRGMIGQPDLTVTLLKPKLQLVQDLLGPRLGSLEIAPGETGDTVRVMEGEDVYPTVAISAKGLQVRGALPDTSDGVGLRSDNEWLIYNMESSEKSLSDLLVQRQQGKFFRLEIQDGTLDMVDTVYGLYRQLTHITLSVTPGWENQATKGRFSAELAGNVTTGTFERTLDEDNAPTIITKVENLDFAALLPFLDDPDGIVAVRGSGALTTSVRYAAPGGKVQSGAFDIDLTGTMLRVRNDLFPIQTSDVHVQWQPELSQFSMDSAHVTIGRSSVDLSGQFVMGLDDVYGPTIGMSLRVGNLTLAPNDMPAPRDSFDEATFTGWSSPLYGAIGIDQMVLRKKGVEIRAKGRVDMLRSGLGIDMEIGGEGASADDLKRLWPYFISTGARDWFVENVHSGRVTSASLKLNLPVGAMRFAEDVVEPLPDGALKIDMDGEDVSFTPWTDMPEIPVPGQISMKVRDNETAISLAQLDLDTDDGKVAISNGSFVIDYSNITETVYEASGNVAAAVPALIALTNKNMPSVLEGVDLPLDITKLSGNVNSDLVTTIVVDATGEMSSIDYAAHGNVGGFTSAEPIAARKISNGQLAFNVTPEGYNISGTAEMDGLPTELALDGTLDGDPDLKVAASIDAKEFTKFGFDVSQFLKGNIRFVAKPLPNGDLQLAVDMTDARLTVADVGLSKAKGVPGTLNALVHQEDGRTNVSDIDLSFGTVKLKGGLAFDDDDGLVSAEFTDFALSAGDNAKISVKPIEGGYSAIVRGEQLDLKPLLKRFFALDQASTGGPQATAIDQTIALDVELDRAPGFYKVTAYNLDANLKVRGEDVQDLSLQAQFAEGSSVSVTTNPAKGGRVMSVAFNDLGTILRFANVYPRLLGGSGSLSMTTNTAQKVDRGEFQLRDFAIVDEDNVVQVLGNHQDSRALIAKKNQLDFDRARVQFVRRTDRIEVTEGLLNSGTIGGTMRGFIYTKAREYDLSGTYVPLFGLNNFFQKIPLFGQLLGGREGEGLLGVTFAIRGGLDEPKFLVNPASALLPGAFRSIFEFRSEEAPREAPQQ